MRTETTNEIGIRNGKHYALEYDRMCNQGGWDSKQYMWFLSIEGSYEGMFKTKKEAYGYIDETTQDNQLVSM